MASQASEDGFSHSMADLMAGVAVTFLLLAAIFMVQRAKKAEGAEDKVKRQAELLAEAEQKIRDLRDLAERLKRMREEVEIDPSDPLLLTIVLRRQEFSFQPGRCDVSTKAEEVLQEEFPQLLRQVCLLADEKRIQSIVLEGHTDAQLYFHSNPECGVPRSVHDRCTRRGDDPDCQAESFANNVRLSAARAQNLFFSLRRALSERDTDGRLASCLDKWFVVSGRGPAEAKNSVDERFRRVVIKIRGRVREETVR